MIGRTLANQHKTGIEFDFDLAQRQHAAMVKIYEDAGVHCHFLDADPVLHRNFFARDSSVMTPWGALICHMQLKCRRADYHSVIRFYQENRIPIWQYATAGHFEGGDFVILEPGTVLIGYGGERSEQAGAEQVAEFVRAKGWDVEVAPIPALFVHMDGLVVPLDRKRLVACVDALEDWVVDWLQARGFEFVEVGFAKRKIWVSTWLRSATSASCRWPVPKSSTKKCAHWDIRFTRPDMSMFTLGGGGVHCLCQALKRDSVEV